MIFYFSGTGNSKWVAEELAAKTNDATVMIAEAKPCYSLAENEAIGFVFPIYAWAPPAIMETFMSSIKFENFNNNYCYFVATCHTQTGNVDGIIKKILKPRGIICSAGFSLNMPNNYLLAPFAKTDSEEKRTNLLLDAQKRIEDIASAITSKRKVFNLTRGSRLLSKLTPLFRKHMTEKDFWLESDKCIQCGKCAQACPVKNIDLTPFPVWKDHCEMCQGCLNVCPVNAIQYGRYSKGKKRYIFEKSLLTSSKS